MPVLDSSAFGGSETLPDRLQCDVCVIGTGPAGATIARELSHTAVRVTVLESGGPERRAEMDELNEIESIGWPRVMDQWRVRNRVIGGSSVTWSGRCAPLNEIDMQPRDWVPDSGWPFEIGDLIPYYDRSAKYLGLGEGSGFSDDRVWDYIGHQRPSPHFDDEKLLSMFWQYSRDPSSKFEQVRFGRYLTPSGLGPNVTLVTNATVLRVNASESGASVESVEFADKGGRRWKLPVSTVVVCAGGIENARILLASDNVVPHGLGNEHDLVGRYLMDHLRGTVARFDIKLGQAVLNRLGSSYYSRAVGTNIYHLGMQLSPAVQRSEQLVNCAIWVNSDRTPNDPFEALMRFLRHEANVYRDLRAILVNRALLFRGLRERYILRRSLPQTVAAVYVQAMCEQVPNRESRVTLTERRDRLAMRIPRIDWRVSDEEPRAMRRATEFMVEQLVRLGLEPPVLEDWVREGAMFPQTFRDVAHPTGTTRMSDDPVRGVVDAQCQVHGVRGLFVAGSSVFPTAGHSNPTHTIVALAIRLADALKAGVRSAAAQASDRSR